MKLNLSKNLIKLSKLLQGDLFIVGGFVRNALMGFCETDIDLTGSKTPEEVIHLLKNQFSVVSDYASFGSLLIMAGEEKYEYTTFRSDSYLNEKHRPTEIFFTKDIEVDAKRRDFTANSVYYNIESGEIIDPLKGVIDIEKKLLRSCNGEKTFQEDGLRILRLLRQMGELNYSIEKETFKYLSNNISMLKGITVERKRVELDKILICDTKYSVSSNEKLFEVLELMKDLTVWNYLIPELMEGVGVEQNPIYHLHDVFYHTIYATINAKPHIRLAALLHDVGKVKAFKDTGTFIIHPEVGSDLVHEILGQNGLKYSKNQVNVTARLVKYHMIDINGDMKENKLRAFFIENQDIIEDLILLKTADGNGRKVVSNADVIEKWQNLWEKMHLEKVPFSVSDLAINGTTVKDIVGIENIKHISTILKKLQLEVSTNRIKNEKGVLESYIPRLLKEVSKC